MMLSDNDSGEMTEFVICSSCHGDGGFDISKDCEEYDDWQECPECLGIGQVEVGDTFVPQRDAWKVGD